MIRCAIYARVSLEEQTDKFGLSSQLTELRARAVEKGYAVISEYIDDGYSGEDLERPAMDRLRKMIDGRGIDVLLAYDPDRLARDIGSLGSVDKQCERRDVRLEFLTTEFDASPSGRAFLQMKGLFAQYERGIIRDRTMRGRREKARRGLIVGGKAPYGYRYSATEKGRLESDPEQAEVVRQIFAWATEGHSVREIAARLNARGIKPHSAARWGRSTISKILQNETYVGQAWYNRRQLAAPDNPDIHRRKKKTLHRPRKQEEWIPISVPAIIDRAVFDAVAGTAARRRQLNVGRKANHEYMLRGLVICARCGRHFGGNPNHGNRYYRCSGRDRSYDPRCTARQVAADRLERVVWESVAGYFRDPDRLTGVVRAHFKQFEQPTGQGIDVGALRRQLERVKNREMRAAEAMLNAEADHMYAHFKAQLSAATQERRRLEWDVARASTSPKSSASIDARVMEICRTAAGEVDRLTGQDRRQFLSQVVDRIVFDGKTASMHCVLPFSGESAIACYRSAQFPTDRISFIINADLEAA